MIRAFCLTSFVLFPAAAAFAQATADADAILHPTAVIVEEPRLVADAAGTTRISLDTFAPPSSQSLESLSGRVANLHLDRGGAGSFGDLLTLRGLSNTPYFSDPAVTLYFDDLPLGSGFTYPTGLFGFARATVLRGPQATTVGRAGEGGVILLQSTEPGATAGGEERVGTGNFNAVSAALTARSRRGDFADATVSAAFSSRNGYIQNTQLGVRVDDTESSAVSARFRMRPTAASEITLQLLGDRLRNGAQPLVPLGGPLFSVARASEGNTAVDFGGVALKAAFDTPAGRLTETTSYTDWTLNPFTNELVLPPALDSSLAQTQRTWNEEVRLASAAHAALPWTVGAWLSTGRTHGSVDRAIPGLFPIEASQYEANADTVALFGETTVWAGDRWHVTAGVRAEEVRKDFDRSQEVPGPGHFSDDARFRSLLPKIAVSYTLAPNTTASASVSAGTKPGGWSAYTGDPALAPFDAEHTLAFEAGVDTSLARRTVNIALRGFAYRIRDYQIERSFTESDYIVVNAPRARSIGAELETTWRPVPELTLAATLGVTDVTLRTFTDPFTGTSYAGNRAPYAPAFDGNLSATYRRSDGWFAAGEIAIVGKTFFDESENPAFAQDEHAVFDARIGYDAPRWRVSVYGENLTNESYYSVIIPGVGHGAPGAPRTYGVEAAVKW